MGVNVVNVAGFVGEKEYSVGLTTYEITYLYGEGNFEVTMTSRLQATNKEKALNQFFKQNGSVKILTVETKDSSKV